MKIKNILMLVFLVFVVLINIVNAIKFEDSVYNVSVSNINYGTGNLSDGDYNIDYSITNEPITDVNDSVYNVYVGFYYPSEDIIVNVTTPIVVPPVITGVAGGGGAHPPSSLIGTYYDVEIIVIGDYKQGENVKANLFLINKGDKPDRDTVLFYYLIDIYGNKIKERRVQLYEVRIGKTEYEIELKLPDTADIGEWKFKVEYIAMGQPRIEVWDSFEVKPALEKISAPVEVVEKIKEVVVPIIPQSLMVLVWIITISLASIAFNLMIIVFWRIFKRRRKEEYKEISKEDKYKKGELIKDIEDCERGKKRIIDYIEKVKSSYKNGNEFFYDNYNEIMKKEIDGKTPGEWIRYYDKLIKLYKKKLKKIK